VAALPQTIPAPKPRLWFLDNLKVALTALVIFHHTGQAYGPTGGFWYYLNPERWPYLGSFFWTNASFFMGLFFFISAYFMPGSFERNGAGKFVKERLVRFGIPALLFLLVINPVMMYFSYHDFRGGNLPLLQYVKEIYFGMGPKPADWKGFWPDLNFGHTWFIEHLLVYAVVYAAWRKLWQRPNTPVPTDQAPSDLAILGYAGGLTIVSLVVRIWYPIDKWIGFLGFIQVEVAHLPQYLSLFVLGTVAYRRNWVLGMPTARGLRWLGIGVAAVLIGWVARALGQSGVIFPIAESFVATGLTVGLCTLFRERWNGAGALAKRLHADAFGAYLIHFPIVVACQYAVGLLPVGPLLRFLLAGALATVGSFLGAHLLRKVPGARIIL
jgi:glucan biosynthesis protein C